MLKRSYAPATGLSSSGETTRGETTKPPSETLRLYFGSRSVSIRKYAASWILDSRPLAWTPVPRLTGDSHASAGRRRDGIALALALGMGTILLSFAPVVLRAVDGLRARLARARRRSPMPRLLARRVPHRAPSVIGACAVCGVKFAASREHRAEVARVLRVHETICPGGHRSGEVATPFE